MKIKTTFLLACADERTRATIAGIIGDNIPEAVTIGAATMDDAYRLMQQHPAAVMICDAAELMRRDYELLRMARREATLKDIYFIVLADSAPPDLILEATSSGADDFIDFVHGEAALTVRLRAAARFVAIREQMKDENKLLQELADELEHSFHDMTLLAVKFLQARIPASTDMLRRVAEAATWIAQVLGGFEPDQLQDLKIASYLCYAGKIFLPDEMLKSPIMTDGRPSNKVMFQVPVSARDIVSGVRRFKDVGNTLYHIYENFDGSGFPERLQSWQIPQASRIIRVALDYEEFRQQGLKSNDAINRIKREANRLYDSKVAILMEQFLAASGSGDAPLGEHPVQLHELEEGMILTRDIVTTNGLKLMTSGSVLHQNLIKRIFSHNSTDPILGQVFVKVG